MLRFRLFDRWQFIFITETRTHVFRFDPGPSGDGVVLAHIIDGDMATPVAACEGVAA